MIAIQMIAVLCSGLCLLANFAVLAMLTDIWRRGENDARLFRLSCSLVALPAVAVGLCLMVGV